MDLLGMNSGEMKRQMQNVEKGIQPKGQGKEAIMMRSILNHMPKKKGQRKVRGSSSQLEMVKDAFSQTPDVMGDIYKTIDQLGICKNKKSKLTLQQALLESGGIADHSRSSRKKPFHPILPFPGIHEPEAALLADDTNTKVYSVRKQKKKANERKKKKAAKAKKVNRIRKEEEDVPNPIHPSVEILT
jgi:hypothetical protein